MAYIKGLTVEIGADASGLVRSINDAERSIRGLNREAGELNRSLKFDPKNINLLSQKQRVLTERVSETNTKVKELEQLQSKLLKAQAGGKDVTENLNDVNRELAVTQSQLDGYTKAMQQVNREVVKYSGVSGQMIKGLEDFGDGAQKVGQQLKGVSVAGTAALTGMGTAAMKFESAFAGVEKTMDDSITPQKLEEIRKGIIDMSKEVPAGTTAISEVAEAAGQLGIETDSILSFTRTMIDMGESTDLSADQAATSMARLANITGMSHDDFDRLGSVIVDLGNNFATTEPEILDMGLRLAGAGKQANMTEADILGIATALSSVGISSQIGGTNFSKLILMMKKDVETGKGNLESFAEVANMTVTEFQKSFEEDAAGALSKFIIGLKDTERLGRSTSVILDEMEIKNSGMTQAILGATQASDLFNDALSTGNKAWDENSALANEANVRYETTEAKLGMLKNQFLAVGIELGEHLLPYIQKFADWLGKLVNKFGNLDDSTQKLIVALTGVAAVASPLLIIVGKMASGIGALSGGVKILGTALGLTNGPLKLTSSAMTGLASAATGTGASISATGGIAATFGGGVAKIATLINPTTLAIAGVGVAGVAMAKHLSQDAIPAVDLFADHVDTSASRVDEFGNIVGGTLVSIGEATQESVEEYMSMSDEMSKKTLELQSGLYENSKTHTDEMKKLNGDMTSYVIQKSEENKESLLADYQEVFENSTSITQEQKDMIIGYTNEEFAKRKQTLENTKEALNTIYAEIAEQGGVITEQQQKRINKLQDLQKNESINALSETEAEAKVIQNRMKEYGERMTAEQASEIVNEYNKMRDETVQASMEQRDATVKLAEEMRAKNPAKFGEMADKMIYDANRLHRDTVSAADDTRKQGLEKLGGAYKTLERDVDINSGKMKTKGQQLWSSIKGGASDAIGWISSLGSTWRNTHFPDKRANIHYSSSGSPGQTPMKYNNGLEYVPFNNYRALLHKGERVLDINENKQLKEQGYLNSTKNKLKGAMENVVNNVDNSVVNNQFVLTGTYHVREEADVERIARQLDRQLAKKGRF